MIRYTIYFVRHGETVWNTERRLQGRKDSALTDAGRAHALANAETLLEAVPNVLALPFVSSPLGRARTSMEIIRKRLGLATEGYAVDERLAELSFGDWEGLTARDVQAKQPGAWEAHEASRWTLVPPVARAISNWSIA